MRKQSEVFGGMRHGRGALPIKMRVPSCVAGGLVCGIVWQGQ